MKKLAAIALSVLMLAGCGSTSSSAASSTAASGVSGTYSGSAQGMESEVKVTLTLDNSKITDVTVDGSGETAELGGKAAESLQSAIKDKGSLDVDTVSGATVTSKAVLEAAGEALKSAGLDPADYGYKAE